MNMKYDKNIHRSVLALFTILIIIVTVSLESNSNSENNVFAAQVKSRHLTSFQSGFIDGFDSSYNGYGNNLGVHHTPEFFKGYSVGHYIGCTSHKIRYPTDTTNCGDAPANDYRSDSYLAGYVDQKEGVINALLHNVHNNSPSMNNYRSGYDDAANPCYGKDCHS